MIQNTLCYYFPQITWKVTHDSAKILLALSHSPFKPTSQFTLTWESECNQDPHAIADNEIPNASANCSARSRESPDCRPVSISQIVLCDNPAFCANAGRDHRPSCRSGVGTPFLSRPLQRQDPQERPDFVIHSYTKDLTGTGSAIAGVVIGRNEDMFVPKGQTIAGKSWEQSLFWNA